MGIVDARASVRLTAGPRSTERLDRVVPDGGRRSYRHRPVPGGDEDDGRDGVARICLIGCHHPITPIRWTSVRGPDERRSPHGIRPNRGPASTAGAPSTSGR